MIINTDEVDWNLPDPHYIYAMVLSYPSIIKTSKKEGIEKILSSDGFYSYLYAKDIIRDRFVLGEYLILENPILCCLYTKHVLKERFSDAEVSIMEHKESRDMYLRILKDLASEDD